VCSQELKKKLYFVEQNLDETLLGNFGGGNTGVVLIKIFSPRKNVSKNSFIFKDWEDRKLGNYLTSETRFEEVLENICNTSEV
jgi:hypothetical protein